VWAVIRRTPGNLHAGDLPASIWPPALSGRGENPGQVSANRPSRACSLTTDGWEAVLSTVHRDHGPGAKVDAITIMQGDQIPDRYLAAVE
jgi:hypothetical protein